MPGQSKLNLLAKCTVEPCTRNGPVIPITALVLSKLTSYTPSPSPIELNSNLNALILADPKPYGKKKIDLLIRSDYFDLILLDGLIRGSSGGLTAQHTIFGWIISGPAKSPSQDATKYRLNVNYIAALDALNDSIRTF